jgi:hypothetical protein
VYLLFEFLPDEQKAWRESGGILKKVSGIYHTKQSFFYRILDCGGYIMDIQPL